MAQAKNYSSIHQSIENWFSGSQEPLALEADWVSPTTFKIGATRSKVDYMEYARYTCNKIHESGLRHPQLRVKIINLPKLIASGRMQEFAVMNCAN